VPVPPSNIREKVQTYVQGLTWPIAGDIALGEALTVQWPRDLHARMAFLQSDLLVDRLMDAINQIANTPCPLAQREQQIAELKGEIDRLMRIEESLVVATGAPRQPGCLPAVVLVAPRPTRRRRDATAPWSDVRS
jgi:hypothetical protein